LIVTGKMAVYFSNYVSTSTNIGNELFAGSQSTMDKDNTATCTIMIMGKEQLPNFDCTVD